MDELAAEATSYCWLATVAGVERASLLVESDAWALELLVEQREELAVPEDGMLGPLVAWTASSGVCNQLAVVGCSTVAVVALVGLLLRKVRAVESLGKLLVAAAGLGWALVEESFAR